MTAPVRKGDIPLTFGLGMRGMWRSRYFLLITTAGGGLKEMEIAFVRKDEDPSRTYDDVRQRRGNVETFFLLNILDKEALKKPEAERFKETLERANEKDVVEVPSWLIAEEFRGKSPATVALQELKAIEDERVKQEGGLETTQAAGQPQEGPDRILHDRQTIAEQIERSRLKIDKGDK